MKYDAPYLKSAQKCKNCATSLGSVVRYNDSSPSRGLTKFNLNQVKQAAAVFFSAPRSLGTKEREVEVGGIIFREKY